jgi:hypothetical protein
MKRDDSKRLEPQYTRVQSEFPFPYEKLPSLNKGPSAIEELPCYDAKAPSIRRTLETPSHKQVQYDNLFTYVTVGY